MRDRREARRGWFASRYYRNHHRWRVAYRPYWWAWRHNWYVGFTPWYGSVFWPYAYADIFAFTFWPGGYAPGYWAYAYDDFFDGIFWGYGAPAGGYGYAYASAPESSSSSTAVARTRTSTEVDVAAARELCTEPASGITAWPFEEIVEKVNLTDEQIGLLDEMKAAAKDAAQKFAESCPTDPNFATTPPSRLDAMTARLFATLQAVQTVRPSLERFYASLSDEQKEAFNQIGPDEAKIAASSRGRGENQPSTVGAAAADQGANCGEAKSDLTNLPIDRIANAVKPTGEQQAQLHELETATGNAVEILASACPDQVPLTPPGRLEAMETRLKAMLEAANTVKPALDTFYSSLNDEQKARFNKLGREVRASKN